MAEALPRVEKLRESLWTTKSSRDRNVVDCLIMNQLTTKVTVPPQMVYCTVCVETKKLDAHFFQGPVEYEFILEQLPSYQN